MFVQSVPDLLSDSAPPQPNGSMVVQVEINAFRSSIRRWAVQSLTHVRCVADLVVSKWGSGNGLTGVAHAPRALWWAFCGRGALSPDAFGWPLYRR